MKIFISGPMSGIEDFNRAAFNEAEAELRQMCFDVFNPAWLKFTDGWSHDEMLAIDKEALNWCDGLLMLPGWNKSDGAREELMYACSDAKTIFFGIEEVVAYHNQTCFQFESGDRRREVDIAIDDLCPVCMLAVQKSIDEGKAKNHDNA